MQTNDFYYSDNDATIYHGDRINLISDIRNMGDRAKLIITSPPYNIGKEYETKSSFDVYLESQKQTIRECLSILDDNGSICWQVGHYIDGNGKDKENFPLDLVLYPIFKEFGLKLKNRIVWTFGHGLHDKYRFSGRHETILWFVKSDNYTFNLDPVRVPQKYPGKKYFKGDKKGQLSGNPNGKNPSDIWDIPNVKANHVEKTDHPCQFPIALVERMVLALTNENDLVLDPYLGSGTTAIAALLHHRRIAGSDIEKKYLDIARKRIADLSNGTLLYRDMNQPVHIPDENSSLVRIPQEWEK